ncbi:MAG: S-methyl-5'-thioadenosine phosphorylase [Chloroflexi bacterium]|nr:S-methyl-5'-thioadenosine phosphorylase [Chloroflexota bacterium]
MTNSDSTNAVGIIGGTGLYDIDGFDDAQWVKIESAFGEPSDELLIGDFEGHRLVFLPRHGRGHRIPPTEINYRANIEALKRAGVDRVVSFSAVGSLKEDLKPGMFVVVDQFIDRTFAREKSFFGTGFVAHVSMADPVCSTTSSAVADAAEELGLDYAVGGTYLAMEGPQFSSRAESGLYRSWDCDVIGMTNMPEAKLAREAELAYATVAMVTDYDCWHEDHDDVNTASILEVLKTNTTHAKNLIKALVPKLAALEAPFDSGAHTALEHAIATPPEHRDPDLTAKLSVVAGRVLGSGGW